MVACRGIKEKGNAILIVLLLTTVLASVALAMGHLTLAEMKMETGMEDATIAYHAAEAGIEDGLLRWRYDRNVETTPDKVTRVDIVDGVVSKDIDPTTDISVPSHQYYDLKITYKMAEVGNYSDFDNPLRDQAQDKKLKQDETLELGGFKLNTTLDMKFYYASITNNNLMEVKIIPQNGPETVTIYNKTATSAIINVPAQGMVRIKPWGSEIRYGIATSAGDPTFDSGETVIESVGNFGSSKRKLQARIDRKSGTLMGIYDFVLYGGKGNIE